MEADKAKRFTIEQSQRLYIGHKEGQPQVFNLKYKSKGSITNYSIFEQALSILKQKIRNFKNDLNTETNFDFKEDTNAMNAIDVITTVAGHTVGNLLVEYSRLHPGTEYIAYKVPHPLKNEMYIRIKCTDQYRSQSALSHKDRAVNILNDTCNHIIDILNVLEDEYTTFSKLDEELNA